MTNDQKYTHNAKMVSRALDYLEQCRFKPNSKLDRAYQIFNQTDQYTIRKDTDLKTNDY